MRYAGFQLASVQA